MCYYKSSKSRFLNQKPNEKNKKKVVEIILVLSFSYTNSYKTCKLIVESA